MNIAIIVLVILLFLCLFRIWQGPTIADRMVAIDILGILVVGICALFAVVSRQKFLIDIALAWIFLGFIGTLALAKYLSGKSLNE